MGSTGQGGQRRQVETGSSAAAGGFAAAPPRRAPMVSILVIGVGLMLAPAIFQMFSRAPEGGDMITDFRPYMEPAKIAEFKGYMSVMGAADREIDDEVVPMLEQRLGFDSVDIAARFGPFDSFTRSWPTIDDDMGGMLDTMSENVDNYDAVAALPPFPLFPWFFVMPGLILVGISLWAWVESRRGWASRPAVIAALVMGLGLVAAPAIFQMFTRAPKGADMITDFSDFMTENKLRTIQGYFVTLAAGEGSYRTGVVTTLQNEGGLSANEIDAEFPKAQEFSAQWPTIFREFAPMVGTMQANLDNFAAVDALPAFWLFPWFFVAPGVLVAGLAVAAGRPHRNDESRSAVLAAGGS